MGERLSVCRSTDDGDVMWQDDGNLNLTQRQNIPLRFCSVILCNAFSSFCAPKMNYYPLPLLQKSFGCRGGVIIIHRGGLFALYLL